MASSEWRLSLKLLDQPSLLKSVLQFPEPEPGDVPPGEYRVSTLKQLVSAHIPDAIPDPELIEIVYCGRKLKDDLTLESYGIQSGSTVHILRKSWPEPEIHPEPVDKVAASREFRVLQAALHTSTAYRDSVFKMLNNKESLDQIMVATPGLSSDPVALGVLQDKDLFIQFTDPNMLDTMSSLNNQWQSQLQQLRDMGIRDEELILRALQATGGDIQAALELIFAGGAP
uniref:Ubiquitin-like 7a (bone marrow stromal cell-derived) n=1 Tax=Cyprinus carpio TaxID=7962 RepID=A0A8C1LM68_CYPCA